LLKPHVKSGVPLPITPKTTSPFSSLRYFASPGTRENVAASAASDVFQVPKNVAPLNCPNG